MDSPFKIKIFDLNRPDHPHFLYQNEGGDWTHSDILGARLPLQFSGIVNNVEFLLALNAAETGVEALKVIERYGNSARFKYKLISPLTAAYESRRDEVTACLREEGLRLLDLPASDSALIGKLRDAREAYGINAMCLFFVSFADECEAEWKKVEDSYGASFNRQFVPEFLRCKLIEHYGLELQLINEQAGPWGWAIFEVRCEGHPPFELQYDHEKGLFSSDGDVWGDVIWHANLLIEPHTSALQWLAKNSPEEIEMIARTWPEIRKLECLNMS